MGETIAVHGVREKLLNIYQPPLGSHYPYAWDSPSPMALKFGLRSCEVLGGSIRSLPDSADFSVNMAAEINAPATISLHTQDFGVPDRTLLLQALNRTVDALLRGELVYVGCAYGHGRTGTFLGCLYRLSQEVNRLVLGEVDRRDPVDYVRAAYKKAAIETNAQKDFVRRIDFGWLPRRVAFRLNRKLIFDKLFWFPA